VKYPLEPGPEEMRALVRMAMDRLIPYIEGLGDRPAREVNGAADLVARLEEVMPETGRALDATLDLLFEEALSKGNNSAGPGYLAYIPGGGLFHAAVGDLIAKTLNRFMGIWTASPGLVQLELNVVRWFCDLVGFGPEAGGYLASGGSMANFSAVFTARRCKLGDDMRDARIYASDQAHHSVARAAMLAGFSANQVRSIPSDHRWRIDTNALKDALAADRHARPFLVIAQAGSTNTGAVDDLSTLADICDRQDLWLHVDAAYGGFFLMTEHGRKLMVGIERADSVTLDPHKGLFLPYGTGALVVRNQDDLHYAHSMTGDYLSDLQTERRHVDFCLISPELSREFRGLQVWLPFQLLGSEVFREQLKEKLELTRVATEALRVMPGVDIVAEPQLSIVAFRARFDRNEDALNQLWLEAVNARGRVLLSGTWLRGIYVLRICLLCFRTHRDRVDLAIEDLNKELRVLRDKG
jgi:aromatic-L-amino-acid decarboxylase